MTNTNANANAEPTELTPRPVAESEVTLAQMMLPTDANPGGNVHGGTIMKLADTAAGLAAIRHSRHRVATVMMDSMTFLHPVYVGDLVTLHARLNWTGHSSMEIEVRVDAETPITGVRTHTSTAFFVYVAIDEHDNPCPVPPLALKTDEELERWRQAEERRAYRMAARKPASGPPGRSRTGSGRA
jgi:acyl-CoA hydrolase